jgi:hypothetical protein
LDATAIIGEAISRTGIWALEAVETFNLLCIPQLMECDEGEGQIGTIIRTVVEYCERRHALLILDPPRSIETADKMGSWVKNNTSLRHRSAVLYYPRVLVPHYLNNLQAQSIGPCGTIAGMIAGLDRSHGVWRAPAGRDAPLKGIIGLERHLGDEESATLNLLGVNCLRRMPRGGYVCWGNRTLAEHPEWKYVNVCRLALFLEMSILRGTQWVVFEPNDESLWAQIRAGVGAFLYRLFLWGAFGGTTPDEAYFVKCGQETHTRPDLKKGVVNFQVGFAPLRPAEFVTLAFRQGASNIQG